MEEKIPLASLFPEEIEKSLDISPSFRARQIYQWIYKGAENFGEMKNIDAKTRRILEEKAVLRTSSVTKVLKDPDGTVKLQISLFDGRAVETVLLTDRDERKTACVSCQAGCAMGCAFCQTGRLGWGRNLSAAEITEEFLFLEKEAGRLDNIVFMGMGEPLQNLDAIKKTVEILTDKNGRALSQRRITLSTSGICSGIRTLAESSLSVRLAVSLTTADPVLREKLMPVTKSNPLPELKKALEFYAEKTKKRITLEAALLSGENTSRNSAKQLAEFASGLDVYVNLIPWNPVEGVEFRTPSKKECDDFVSYLEEFGVKANLRTRRGVKIGGACGQLGISAKKNKNHCAT